MTKTPYRSVRRTEKFKYIDDIIAPDSNEKGVLGGRERERKMEMAFELCRGTYKSRYISFQAKLKHYCGVVKLPCFCIPETLAKIGDPLFDKNGRKCLKHHSTHESVIIIFLSPKDRPGIVREPQKITTI